MGISSEPEEALAVPPGVEQSIWDAINDEFTKVVAEAGTLHRVASLPAGDAGYVGDFRLEPQPDGTGLCRWTYRNTGDYDQNGEVGMSDLTAIGWFYLVREGDSHWAEALVADGDGNGEVNLADVTPLGLSFNNRIDGYILYEGDQGAEPADADELAVLELGAAVQPDNIGMKEFTQLVAEPVDGRQYWVAPYILQGEERLVGIPSNSDEYITPPKVQGLSASQGELAFSVELSWSELADALLYRLFRSEAEDGTYTYIGEVVAPDTSYVDEAQVGPGVHYWYQVVAVLPGGLSLMSDPAVGWAMEPPPAPQDFRASDGTSDSEIELYWLGVEGAENYLVYRDDQDSLYADIGLPGNPANHWKDTELTDYNNHTYWITAVRDGMESDFSDPDVGYRALPEGRIYEGWYSGGANHFNRYRSSDIGPVDGTVAWELEIPYMDVTVVVDPEGNLYMQSWGTLFGTPGIYKIDSDGEIVWSSDRPGILSTGPVLGENGQVYAGFYDDDAYTVFEFDAETGDSDSLYTGSGRCRQLIPGSDALYIRLYDSGELISVDYSGAHNWTLSDPDGDIGEPAIDAAGTIYAAVNGEDSSYFKAISPAGTIIWSAPVTVLPGSFYTGQPAVLDDGNVLVWIESARDEFNVHFHPGIVTCFSPAGVQLWQFTTSWDHVSNFAQAWHGTIYFASYGVSYGSWDGKCSSAYERAELFALSPSGNAVWATPFDYFNMSGAITVDSAGSVFVMSGIGDVFAFHSNLTIAWIYSEGVSPKKQVPVLGPDGRLYAVTGMYTFTAFGPTGGR